jgi:hypothetical protein
MRRAVASLLLALLCLGFGCSFLQAQPSAIPACCRRDGKHHCAMSLKGDGFRTTAPNCPYRTFRALIPPPTALKLSSSILSIGAQGQLRLLTAPTVIALHTSEITQERGPPISHS